MGYSDNSSTQYQRRMLSRGLVYGIAVAILLGIIAIPACAMFSSYSEHHTVTTVVVDKDRVCKSTDSGSSCEYLVFTERGTYRLADSILIGRFNTSDVYGRIKRCHRYEIEYYGWRFGFTSSYPNIVDAKDLGRAENCEV